MIIVIERGRNEIRTFGRGLEENINVEKEDANIKWARQYTLKEIQTRIDIERERRESNLKGVMRIYIRKG